MAVFLIICAAALSANTSAIGASHSAHDWAPEQATGPPNTPEPGDKPTAWASKTPDGQDEWLLLGYAQEICPAAIEIVETFNPGAVNRVSVFKPDGEEVVVFRGKDPTAADALMGTSRLDVKVPFKTSRVKVYLRSTMVPGWNEIDAVSMIDEHGKRFWASTATASSTWGDVTRTAGANEMPPWSAMQASGPPDTQSGYGDFSTAWASSSADGQDEWLLLDYAKEVIPHAVAVHECYNPGALYKIAIFTAAGKEVPLWTGVDPTSITLKDSAVSVIAVHTTLKTKRVKLYLHSKTVPGFNEIDAVELRDADGKGQWAIKAAASSESRNR